MIHLSVQSDPFQRVNNLQSMFDVPLLQCSIINWVSIKQLQMIWLNITPCPRGTYLMTSFLKIIENSWIIVLSLWWHIHKSRTLRKTVAVRDLLIATALVWWCVLVVSVWNRELARGNCLFAEKRKWVVSSSHKCDYRICISPSASWLKGCLKRTSHQHQRHHVHENAYVFIVFSVLNSRYLIAGEKLLPVFQVLHWICG